MKRREEKRMFREVEVVGIPRSVVDISLEEKFIHVGYNIDSSNIPVDTGRKLNVYKMFRRRPGRLLNVLCTFNLRSVSTGIEASLSPNRMTDVSQSFSGERIAKFPKIKNRGH